MRRLIAVDERSVTFKVKNYRIEGPGRYTTMTLDVREFIRRFLIHVLPKGFYRIRHYGLFTTGNRAKTIAGARQLMIVEQRITHVSEQLQQHHADVVSRRTVLWAFSNLVVQPDQAPFGHRIYQPDRS
jgi:hypothetical protein